MELHLAGVYDDMAVGETRSLDTSGAFGVGASFNLAQALGPYASSVLNLGGEAHAALFSKSSVSITRTATGFQLTVTDHSGLETGGSGGATALGAGASAKAVTQKGKFQQLVLDFKGPFAAQNLAAFRTAIMPGGADGVSRMPVLGKDFTVNTQLTHVGLGATLHTESDTLRPNGNYGLRRTQNQSESTYVRQTGGGSFRQWLTQSTTRAWRLISSPFRSKVQVEGGMNVSATGSTTMVPPKATVAFSLSKLDKMNHTTTEGIAERDRQVEKLTQRLVDQLNGMNGTYTSQKGGQRNQIRVLDATGVNTIRRQVSEAVDRAIQMKDEVNARRDGSWTSFFTAPFRRQAVSVDFPFTYNRESSSYNISEPQLHYEGENAISASYTTPGIGVHVSASVRDTNRTLLDPTTAR